MDVQVLNPHQQSNKQTAANGAFPTKSVICLKQREHVASKLNGAFAMQSLCCGEFACVNPLLYINRNEAGSLCAN
ncbi:hypothetical protein TSMEX_010410, partial [Taenia solium]